MNSLIFLSFSLIEGQTRCGAGRSTNESSQHFFLKKENSRQYPNSDQGYSTEGFIFPPHVLLLIKFDTYTLLERGARPGPFFLSIRANSDLRSYNF